MPPPFPASSVPRTPVLDDDDGYYQVGLRRSVSWGAIFAGISAALGLQVLFMLLGAGLGFALYSPMTDANPIATLGAGALIVQGISAVLSLWFGGWVAGRFTPIEFGATGWLAASYGGYQGARCANSQDDLDVPEV